MNKLGSIKNIKNTEPGTILFLKKPTLALNLELFCEDKDQISNWFKESLVKKNCCFN